MICSDLQEMALASLAPALRRCVHLLEALDSLGGHSTAAQWGDIRVQGGSKVPAAERRAELIEALESMPPKLLRITRQIRGYPPDSPRGRYIAGLLRGMSGEDLRRAAGLSVGKMTTCRKWLKSVMASCQV